MTKNTCRLRLRLRLALAPTFFLADASLASRASSFSTSTELDMAPLSTGRESEAWVAVRDDWEGPFVMILGVGVGVDVGVGVERQMYAKMYYMDRKIKSVVS